MKRTDNNKRVAVVIGAGPAGLTAALELLRRTDFVPIVLEKDAWIGGLSRTVPFKGNRMDIGGHRFFSKSDRVLQWWFGILPVEATPGKKTISYQGSTRPVQIPDSQTSGEKVMLVRPRKSRIYFLKKFFDYPISLSQSTVWNLGLVRSLLALLSYLRSACFPIRPESSLEDFFINRFGRRLYRSFFKAYTEKVWGVPCHAIDAEWGRQRIKGLSIRSALLHMLRRLSPISPQMGHVKTETSLIEEFLYPKLGPGQMWEEVAKQIEELGGSIIHGIEVSQVCWSGSKVVSIEGIDRSGTKRKFDGDLFFSSLPIQNLVRSASPSPSKEILDVGNGLLYRDFITVGMLLQELKIKENHSSSDKLIRDNWIYIQEPEVQIGRLQIFNNWSPSMVADSTKAWLGLEYFCSESDSLWQMSDEQLIELGKKELTEIGIIDPTAFLDAVVLRVPKAYPAYFGTYPQFGHVQSWLNTLENFFPIGRNGMHRYNNQDHSMLTAMVAVDNILAGRTDKSNLWEVNAEEEYHETRKEDQNSRPT